MGIISYNDQGYKEILSGGITVLSNQPEKIGRRAAALIGESYKTTEEIDLELIVRLSL